MHRPDPVARALASCRICELNSTNKVNRYRLCPCDTKRLYGKCCGLFHSGSGLPPDALSLMRSRYSAYVLNIPDYIIETTHPENPHYQENKSAWKRELEYFSQSTKFIFLEIREFVDGPVCAYVGFTAHLQQSGQDVSLVERSEFLKVDGRWLYRNGEVT